MTDAAGDDPYGWSKAADEVARLYAVDLNTELERINDAERQVYRLKTLYLRCRQWRRCFDVPLGTETWTKALPDGRTLIAPMDTAMLLQQDLEARDAG
jgi:hypothetical protein